MSRPVEDRELDHSLNLLEQVSDVAQVLLEQGLAGRASPQEALHVTQSIRQVARRALCVGPLVSDVECSRVPLRLRTAVHFQDGCLCHGE